MKTARIAELRAELEAGTISYGEAGEIQEAFAELPRDALRDDPDSATLADMLDEIEAQAVPLDERVTYTLARLRTWVRNYEANAGHAANDGRHDRAREYRATKDMLEVVVKMLDGTEDAYIRQLRNARGKA